jgi:mono/diheme cytochrome c family protein
MAMIRKFWKPFAGSLSLSCIAAAVVWQVSCACHAGETKQAPSAPIVIKPSGYKPQPATAESEAGRNEYNRAHCSACHAIDNSGGSVGPLLDGIGQKRSKDFLFARLANTQEATVEYARLIEQKPDDLFPHIRVTPAIARSLAAYLLTLPEPKGGFVVLGHPGATTESNEEADHEFHPAPKTASSEEGKRLYEKLGCAQCHQINQQGGYFGMALDGIGRLRNREYIAAHITNAQVHAAQNDKFFETVPTAMPKFNITPKQVQSIPIT